MLGSGDFRTDDNHDRTREGSEEGRARLPLRGLAPLRHRGYAWYMAGNGPSFIGSQAEIVASAWVLYALTDSPLLLGLGGLFHALPIFLFVPFAGVLADRWSPRRILLVTSAVGLSASLALGILILLGLVQPWHVYLQALVSATAGTFDTTARQALFPRLVPRSELDEAVNLNFAASRISMLSGPAVGGLLTAVVSPAATFFFNVSTFVVLLAAMFALREPPVAAPPARRSPTADLFAGVAFMSRSQLITAVMLFAALWGLLSHNATLLTVFARDVFGAGAEGLGLLLSAAAAGQLVGSLGLVASGGVRRKGRLLIAIGLVYSAAMLAFAFSRWMLLSCALLLVAGAGFAIFSAIRHALLQRQSPDDLRGRVMGTHLLVTRGAGPLSQLVAGVLIAAFGPTEALVISTGLLALATVGVALASPALRNYSDIVPEPRPAH